MRAHALLLLDLLMLGLVVVRPLVSQSIVRIDNLCCGAEAKLARSLLAPLEDVIDVKISIAERRAAIEHRANLPAAEIVRVLNSKFLGASIADSSSTTASASSGGFLFPEFVRASRTTIQIALFGLAVGLHLRQALPRVSLACAWASIALSFPMLRKAYLAVLRKSPNVEFLMALATGGSLLLGDVLEVHAFG